MQPLKNERHERFAQLVALGSSHESAYVSAGFSKRGASQSAARLLAVASVNARVAELVAAGAERVEITLESLIRDAARCRDLGIWHGQINAAVLAVKELGILTGFRIEKRETRRLDPATVSDEQLLEIILRSGAVDVKAVELEARARLEAPVSNGYTQAGQSRETVSASHMGSGDTSETPRAAALDPNETRAREILEAPAPGVLERRVRGLRRGRATTQPRPDLDATSKA